MTRISRVSPLKTARIHEIYVNRMTNVAYVDYIESIERLEKSNKPMNHSSENYLLSYEHYYKSIQELKKEFKRFYHHEKELHEAISQLDKNNKQVIIQTDNLIHKYNQALTALRDFDSLAGSNHVESIHHVFTTFAKDFAEIGITENSDYTLSLDTKRFLDFLLHSDQSDAELISRFKSMILKEYQSFMRIKGPKKQIDAYETQPLTVKGLMIEEKL
ncbi:hypothetical protein [Halalkalibacter nanhaiisediminis]|uniref:Uncharacterized protein n=1 Tax=Halalkalibacter nanhaiisediminis TaxID=688079 RepID=A0A562QMG8_9BACI|nr:hypothetical protein [Halalkalibacter nanhaiisediminis]TWI57246.1 hypothetical protein IQ10_01952 [Halalkalibacter nanhaiisediminis]